jgi:hypothetical protein
LLHTEYARQDSNCDLLIRGDRPTARRTGEAGEKGTKRSIYAPLVANLLITSSKFVVGFVSAIFACSSGRSKDSGRPWSRVVGLIKRLRE